MATDGRKRSSRKSEQRTPQKGAGRGRGAYSGQNVGGQGGPTMSQGGMMPGGSDMEAWEQEGAEGMLPEGGFRYGEYHPAVPMAPISVRSRLV